MRHNVEDMSLEKVTKDECHHYWVIESPNGPTSKGVCKFCGAKKEFLNSMPDFTVVKQQTSLFELPELPDIEFDEEQHKS